MNTKRVYGEGIVFTLGNHIYWLFMLNLYFVLTNVVFLLFFMTLERDFSNIPLYFLALIPTGPSISALFYCLDKMLKDKDLSPTKDFFTGYKKNFKDSMKLWIPSLVLLFVFFVDLQYFIVSESSFSTVLSIFFLLASGLISLMVLNAFIINLNFAFRLRDLYRLSAYYIIRKLKITLGNIGIIFISLFIISLTNNFLILFFAILIFYLILLNSKDLVEDVQTNFTKSE
ncbi:YesL family protein [Bacillus timonensis]|uniref:YesL family protein n=1 Tax=Bacillus timonensis TaxID=1033734 RepID=UPI000289F8F0|nr:YesL family protein [Bacillus timonensis]